jgi:hypothetical protein
MNANLITAVAGELGALSAASAAIATNGGCRKEARRVANWPSEKRGNARRSTVTSSQSVASRHRYF